ncbi:MAG: glycerate kinase [Firmicutes bacterium]|jgi:glycerate kinase|uniref:Glycerate kinase n=1 Tax=Sulfobacillus benefaciens TaxID=453960 RepID=A0A2T2X4F3_9FIRM|nr:glycerate kinase [Bacillota bacterium]MCL5013976.1 glycerate kinase [Bacillota bacterium]PSR29336.1 MAG: glycerate kinase [Sulfobacillus benefaciens]
MKIVVAPDSFKGTFTAQQAAVAMAQGCAQVVPGSDIVLKPMADGGEGSLDAVLSATPAEPVSIQTVDSYGRPISAIYGWHDRTAWIELAQTCGLHFFADAPSASDSKNQWALRASTWGAGVQWHHAIARGAQQIFFMIGGSGTTDGGFGLLGALGAHYWYQETLLSGDDARQLALPIRIENIDAVRELLEPTTVVVATDVTNPLCGSQGASAVYGPQKGLSPEGVHQRDQELKRFGILLAQAAGARDTSVMFEEGMGAAGGTAFPLRLLARNLRLVRGAELIAESIGLEAAIAQADVVFTGEGATDAQTLAGKVPVSVLRLCRQYHKRCVVVSGHLGQGAEQLKTLGDVWLEQATPDGASPLDIEQHGQQWIAQAAARALQFVMHGA